MAPKFVMTNTELRLKRQRLQAAFVAGKKALEDLRLPYFLAYGSAVGILCEGQFQAHEDDVHVGIYAWDLAGLQRGCSDSTAAARDKLIASVFETFGFEPVTEMVEQQHAQSDEAAAESTPPSVSACPRVYTTESWSDEQAFPIIYKFTHRDSTVRFNAITFTSQFGCFWDFADGGAETSSGWRYSPFAPQPVEFNGEATFTMPEQPLREHYGQDWHAVQPLGYVESLSVCENRCQVLRVQPFDVNMATVKLPPPVALNDFQKDVQTFRMKRAKALADSPFEVLPKELDLFRIECKPSVLLLAAGLCKSDGNELLKSGALDKALDRYDEGVYILDKAREVLLSWRLVFRGIHNERAEKDRSKRGLAQADVMEEEVPHEFRKDEHEERNLRLSLLLNAAQAAISNERCSDAEARASSALEIDGKNHKGLYRRGLARQRAGRIDAARADFWTLVKVSSFQSKEALQQLVQMSSKDEVQAALRRLKAEAERERRLGAILTDMGTDERVMIQEERYQRYRVDCEQRRLDGHREITFDEWATQYEWRYDADERTKTRDKWPEHFSNSGPAPLPVEEWEVDYLTHKEINKIKYHRQTAALAARKRAQNGPEPQDEPAAQNGFSCDLSVDPEDEELLRSAVVEKGYHYWW